MEEIRAKEFKNFLSNEETLRILNFAKNTKLWKKLGNDFWDDRVVNFYIISEHDPELGKFLITIKERLLKTVKDLYNIDKDIYSDILAITRWFPGMHQPPHSDNMENTADHHNHEHREYGIVIYLNDDFEGGQTFYPQHNFYINPEPGKLAVHPASTDHMHGVTKIEGNVRYTLTSFLTFDETKKMSDW